MSPAGQLEKTLENSFRSSRRGFSIICLLENNDVIMGNLNNDVIMGNLMTSSWAIETMTSSWAI